MAKYPKLSSSIVHGLITECKLEIVQSGKIPKGQALLVYNPGLAREGKGEQEKEEGKGGQVKGGQDPVLEFMSIARTEKVRDKIVNYLVGAGILESASSVISNVRVAMHKSPMEGLSDMWSNVLGYSDKKRQMDQDIRKFQIVRVRQYLQKLVNERKREVSDGVAMQRGSEGLRAKAVVGAAEAGGDAGRGVKVNEDSIEKREGVEDDNEYDKGNGAGAGAGAGNGDGAGAGARDGDGGGNGNGIDIGDLW